MIWQHVQSAFYVGCCAGATKQPFVRHNTDACQNSICMKKSTYQGRQHLETVNGSHRF